MGMHSFHEQQILVRGDGLCQEKFNTELQGKFFFKMRRVHGWQIVRKLGVCPDVRPSPRPDSALCKFLVQALVDSSRTMNMVQGLKGSHRLVEQNREGWSRVLC